MDPPQVDHNNNNNHEQDLSQSSKKTRGQQEGNNNNNTKRRYIRFILTILLCIFLFGSFLNTDISIVLSTITTYTTSTISTYVSTSSSSISSPPTTSNYCPQEPCNLSIVFMGDSLTRYMYMSLVYFLRHNNTWIDPNSYSMALVRPKDILGGYELNFDWMPWYNYSMKELWPYESCDCYREPGSITRGIGMKLVTENRYYYDPYRNNTITYFQSNGNHIPVRGHWIEPPQLFLQQQRQQNNSNNIVANITNTSSSLQMNMPMGPMNSRVEHKWSYDWPEAIEHQVSKLQPKVLIMNAGLWLHEFDKPEFVSRLMSAINKTSIPTVIWKTITAKRGGDRYPANHRKTDNYMCSIKSLGCLNISGWTSKLSGFYYVDQGHFKEPIYRKMNEQLFTYLNISLDDVPVVGRQREEDGGNRSSNNKTSWTATNATAKTTMLSWEDIGLVQNENGDYSTKL